MTAVGLIVNPVAGRDIRRLVGLASVVPHHEKTATVRRLLQGLAAAGVDRVCYAPDGTGIVTSALDGRPPPVAMDPLQLDLEGSAADSTRAAALLARQEVGVIVTLGGDGTNRAVAAGCGETPLVALSTGTNNVFPSVVESTVAGLAAGLVATGRVPRAQAARRTKRVEVAVGEVSDFAIVDAAICTDALPGARAIWDPGRVRAIVLTRAEPWAIGLSAIGGRLDPVGPWDDAGLLVELGGDGPAVPAVLAPGVVAGVTVRAHRRLALGEEVEEPAEGGTVALDGERELLCHGPVRLRVERAGPYLVDVHATVAATAGTAT